MFPLNQMCAGSLGVNFGSSVLTTDLMVTGSVTMMSNPATALGNTPWFPTASSAFPATPSIVGQGAPLNVFGGSFTISLMMISGSVPGVDVPILEFLGPLEGQVCATIRMGYTATSVEFFWNSACKCQTNPTGFTDTGGILLAASCRATTSWTHLAFTYDASSKFWAIYVNGTVTSSGSQALGSLTTTVYAHYGNLIIVPHAYRRVSLTE
jgi:hypothetical protein